MNSGIPMPLPQVPPDDDGADHHLTTLPTTPLFRPTDVPPLPTGVHDELDPDDVLDLARMRTRRMLPLEAQANLREMLALIREGHLADARQISRALAQEEHDIADLCEIADHYRERIETLTAISPALRSDQDALQLRGWQASLAELERDIQTLCLSHDDHERQRREHVQAAEAISRSLRPVDAR
jgi:hypothetical protein